MSNFFGLLQTGGMFATTSARLAGGGTGTDFEVRALFTWVGEEDLFIYGRETASSHSLFLSNSGSETTITARFSSNRSFSGPLITKGEPHLLTLRRVDNEITAFIDGVEYGSPVSDVGQHSPLDFMIRNGVTSDVGTVLWYLEADQDGLPYRRWYNRTGTGTNFVCELTGTVATISNGTGDNTQWTEFTGSEPDPGPDPDPDLEVESIWTGHVTPNSVTASARVSGAAEAKFVVATDDGFTNIVSETSLMAPDAFGIIRGTLTGLAPGTGYHFGVSDGTNVAAFFGGFRTADSGAHSFTFGTASCAHTGSNELIFDTIRNDDLDFFVHTGDIHYADISTNNVSLFHSAMNQVFGAERQRNLWASLPMYYMWDDHDYGPNDSHKDSPARQAAIEFYRNRVPSPALVQSGSDDAVYYSFVRGRVRFIVTDLRSEREEKGAFPSLDPQQEMMSKTQLAWFKSELDAANVASQIVCWVNTIPWVTSVTDGQDHWGGYAAQRQEVADYITAQDYNGKIFIISGDMHRLAFDDGTSSNNEANLYTVQSAPLDRGASSKGGPYLIGPIGGSGTISQYSTIDVTDSGGDDISIKVDGWSVNRETGDKSLEYTQTFSLSAVPTGEPEQRELILNVQGIPNGTYNVRLFNSAAGTFIETASLTFTGGEATYSTELATGTVIEGYILDGNEPPENGAIIYGTVTDA